MNAQSATAAALRVRIAELQAQNASLASKGAALTRECTALGVKPPAATSAPVDGPKPGTAEYNVMIAAGLTPHGWALAGQIGQLSADGRTLTLTDGRKVDAKAFVADMQRAG